MAGLEERGRIVEARLEFDEERYFGSKRTEISLVAEDRTLKTWVIDCELLSYLNRSNNPFNPIKVFVLNEEEE